MVVSSDMICHLDVDYVRPSYRLDASRQVPSYLIGVSLSCHTVKRWLWLSWWKVLSRHIAMYCIVPSSRDGTKWLILASRSGSARLRLGIVRRTVLQWVDLECRVGQN